MRSGRRRPHARACGPALVLVALTLTACAEEGPTAAERSLATTLPTPTQPGADTSRILRDRVRTLLSASVVTADEDVVVDHTQTETRLSWKVRGTVVGASVLRIGSSGSGVAVYRSPTVFLSRRTGEGEGCWSPAGPSLARYDRATVPELGLLRSARATGGDGSLVEGSVSARAALRIIGTDDDLGARGLLPPADARVPASFATTEPGLLITLEWSDLVGAARSSSHHGDAGTWILRFLPGGTAGPVAPRPGMMCP